MSDSVFNAKRQVSLLVSEVWGSVVARHYLRVRIAVPEVVDVDAFFGLPRHVGLGPSGGIIGAVCCCRSGLLCIVWRISLLLFVERNRC